MRSTIQVLLTFTALLVAPATASAAFIHIVAPGESLSSVAAADGLSVGQLAAANGLSTSAGLLAGSPLTIPPQTPGVAGVTAGAPATAAGGEESGEAAPDGDEVTAPATSAAGGYVVRRGDTLSAIAAANGMTVDQLAADNGLSVSGILLAGSTLNLGGASSAAPAASGAPAPGGAQPTAMSVSPSEVGQVAAANGVSSSLAEAIGYQESGFNNSFVSGTGAIGVMQIEPGTWNFIERNLAGSSLSPNSAVDNVKGGVLLLRSLLDQTGGDPNLAVAGYYQGLRSVREHGMFPDTQRYVADVMALAQRFGGP